MQSIALTMFRHIFLVLQFSSSYQYARRLCQFRARVAYRHTSAATDAARAQFSLSSQNICIVGEWRWHKLNSNYKSACDQYTQGLRVEWPPCTANAAAPILKSPTTKQKHITQNHTAGRIHLGRHTTAIKHFVIKKVCVGVVCGWRTQRLIHRRANKAPDLPLDSPGQAGKALIAAWKLSHLNARIMLISFDCFLLVALDLMPPGPPLVHHAFAEKSNGA